MGVAPRASAPSPAFVLIVIVDAPTVPWLAARPALAEIFAAGLGPGVLALDRDRPPGAGGPSDRERLARLRELRRMTADAGAVLGVTGRVDLALASDADAVQLPERGMSVAEARRIAGAALRVGRSCHDRAGLLAAAAAGADWATLAPIARPWTKAPSQPPLGVDGFVAATAGVPIAVFGLGGIGPTMAASLRAAGAAGVATIGGVLPTSHGVGAGGPGDATADGPASRARALLLAGGWPC